MTRLATLPDDRRHIGLAGMLAYWFAQYTLLLALLTPIIIAIALKLGAIVTPSQKGAYLGVILGVGAFGAMVAAPIWGAISDRTTFRLGRRKTWIVVGQLLLLCGLLIMALANDPLIFGCGWLVCQVGSNAAQAALNAVMSDVVPDHRHGIMSALISGSITFAIVSGVVITKFTQGNTLLLFVGPWLLSPVAVAIFLWVVPDSPARPAEAERFSLLAIARSMWISPRRYPNFAWAFGSRFLVTLASAYLNSYQVYYLTDRMHIPRTEVAQYMVLSTSVMGLVAFAVSLAGGWLSDRLDSRKPFVAGAAVLAAIGLAGIAMAETFDQFLVAAAIASIGQGLYFAVDIALCVEVLPDPEDAAKDMAVLQIANSLPQSLAPLLAPLLLAIGGYGQNYTALFVAAGCFALLGAAAILPVQRRRRPLLHGAVVEAAL